MVTGPCKEPARGSVPGWRHDSLRAAAWFLASTGAMVAANC